MSDTSHLTPALPAVLEALARGGIGVVVFSVRDGVTHKLYANEPAARSLGYSPAEWLVRPLWSSLAPEQRPVVLRLFERLSANEPIPALIELRFRHREGHSVTAEAVAGRAVDDGGSTLAVIFRDLALHRQDQLSMLEADRVALVGALAAGFAHETNNPLTSVLLNLRSLRKQLTAHLTDTAQANALRCLDDITTGAERIASNVRALQTLATRSLTKPIDLAALVSSALRLAAPTLEARARVTRQISPVASVAGEESRLGQAVLAMLLFSGSGFDRDTGDATNQIDVVVEQRDRLIVVEVSDNGGRLTTEEVAHVFDPFFRSQTRGAGVGVGLGVAQSVAMALGGAVSLVARPGAGAVITMRLPAADQEPASGDATARPA